VVDFLCGLWLTSGMTTKRINQLAVGDRVASVEGVTFDAICTVTEVRTVTVKGKTFPAFVLLNGGRFWPTGKADPRTCSVV